MADDIKKPVIPTIPERDHLNDFLIEWAPKLNLHANQLKEKLGSGKDPSELYQAGMHGLIEAIHSYDPSKGASFATHADNRIRGKMQDHITSGASEGANWIPNYHYKQAKAFEAKQKAKPPAKD